MATPAIERLGGVGIWSRELRYNSDRLACQEAARELEALGYTALWLPDAGGDPLGIASQLLDVTDHILLATGILNIWMHDPADVVSRYRQVIDKYGDRFVLGLGNSHAPLVDAESPGRYDRPVAKMVEFLDGLAAAGLSTKETTILAALGPRMQRIVRDRAAGSHPYLVNASYLRQARTTLGDDACLAPELGVVIDPDPVSGRARARAHISGYFALPNYRNNFLRMGYDESDFRGGGSDRLIDAVVAWGTVARIGERVEEYFRAGANHICLQIVGVPDEQLPMDDWRALSALIG